MIFQYQGNVQGFVNLYPITKPSLDDESGFACCSSRFLTKDDFVSHSETGDMVYTFGIYKGEDNDIGVAGSYDEIGEVYDEHFYVLVLPNAYRPLAKDEFIDLYRAESPLEEITSSASAAS